jgi:predicted transcriptional regulator of viral defense system
VNIIAQIRQNINGEVFDYQVLSDVLAEYRKPRDKITRLLASGAIVRVKKGLYCFGEPFRREPLSREHLANLIYGPSYVSLEYALSYHGLIPERVETVTSVTTRRSRNFSTPFGAFSYRMLTGSRYAAGITLETAGRISYLMASPEKALADKVWTDKRFKGLRLSEYEAYLSDDLRLDLEVLSRFEPSRLQTVAAAYRSTKIDNLIKYLLRLKETADA